MWPATFEHRLQSWQCLRQRAVSLPQHECLSVINQWWFAAPWRSYYLHWDDQAQWPDPWQLLDDNVFCSLARGLGMLYTIAMLDRDDMHTADLVESDLDNLVLIDSGKYVLNWDPDTIVNINPGAVRQHRRLPHSTIKHTIP